MTNQEMLISLLPLLMTVSTRDIVLCRSSWTDKAKPDDLVFKFNCLTFSCWIVISCRQPLSVLPRIKLSSLTTLAPSDGPPDWGEQILALPPAAAPEPAHPAGRDVPAPAPWHPECLPGHFDRAGGKPHLCLGPAGGGAHPRDQGVPHYSPCTEGHPCQPTAWQEMTSTACATKDKRETLWACSAPGKKSNLYDQPPDNILFFFFV